MGNKSIILKCITILLLLFVIFIFTSCTTFIDSLFESSYAEEELVVTGGRNYGEYIYSDKVCVHLAYGGKKDSLSIRITNHNDWVYDAYEVLSGEFLEVAWNDFILFVHLDDIYYTFDIKSYKVPEQSALPTNIKGKNKYKEIVPEYDLCKYSIDDFKNEYPDYKNFEWYSH